MEHGKHARHRRRVQRRPHLIVSFLVSFLRLVRRLVPARAVISSRHSVPSSSYPRPVGRYEKRGGFSHQSVLSAGLVFPYAPRRFTKLIHSIIPSCRFVPRLTGRM